MKKIILITVAAILISLGIPLLMGYLIFVKAVPTVIVKSDWISFLGSYLGGILGGIATLVTIYISINKTDEIQKYANDRQDMFEKRERVKDAFAILPYINFAQGEGQIIGSFKENCCANGNKMEYNFNFDFKIKNIGKSIASIKAYDVRVDLNKKGKYERHVKESNVSTTINSGEEKVITVSECIETNENSVDINIRGIIFIILKFEDIFRNKYSQILTVSIKERKDCAIRKDIVVTSMNVQIPELIELSKPDEIIGSKLL